MFNFTEVKQILLGLDSTHLCDALKSQVRVLSPDIRLVQSNLRFKLIGKALTVKAEGDVLPIIKAISLASSNSVIVVQAENDTSAVIGELLTHEACRRNIPGIIVDGFCRDIVNIETCGCLLFAKGRRPNVGSKEKSGVLHIPVTVGGITINPGELIFADPDGIIVLNEQELNQAIPPALEICQREQGLLARIQKGESLIDLTDFDALYRKIAV